MERFIAWSGSSADSMLMAYPVMIAQWERIVSFDLVPVVTTAVRTVNRKRRMKQTIHLLVKDTSSVEALMEVCGPEPPADMISTLASYPEYIDTVGWDVAGILLARCCVASRRDIDGTVTLVDCLLDHRPHRELAEIMLRVISAMLRDGGGDHPPLLHILEKLDPDECRAVFEDFVRDEEVYTLLSSQDDEAWECEIRAFISGVLLGDTDKMTSLKHEAKGMRGAEQETAQDRPSLETLVRNILKSV
jgi:hypothetical protein